MSRAFGCSQFHVECPGLEELWAAGLLDGEMSELRTSHTPSGHCASSLRGRDSLFRALLAAVASRSSASVNREVSSLISRSKSRLDRLGRSALSAALALLLARSQGQ